MARLAGKMRGDMRAMEEESMRHNPMVGRGATPSMGLSQFRGGRRHEEEEESESDEELEGGETYHGGARSRKRMSKAARMGAHLSHHIHTLHGAGWWDDFKSGFNSVMSPVASVAKSVLPMLGPEGMAASGVIGALGYGRRRGCGTGAGKLTITHGGATNSDTGAYHGKGRESDDQRMVGMGRRKRAPAGPSDGRRKRAEIVRRVMDEQGLSMIEASKYVKANGLY